jgi:hypothetical protein
MVGAGIGFVATSVVAVASLRPGIVGDIARFVSAAGGGLGYWGATKSWARMRRSSKQKGEASQ